VSLTSEF